MTASEETTRVLFDKGTNVASDEPVHDGVPASALSFGGAPGLRAEYFDNPNLEGAALHIRTDAVSIRTGCTFPSPTSPIGSSPSVGRAP